MNQSQLKAIKLSFQCLQAALLNGNEEVPSDDDHCLLVLAAGGNHKVDTPASTLAAEVLQRAVNREGYFEGMKPGLQKSHCERDNGLTIPGYCGGKYVGELCEKCGLPDWEPPKPILKL